MRLIDAENAEKKITQIAASLPPSTREPFLAIALYMRNESDLPTIDAVPVVRCKDCKWHTDRFICNNFDVMGFKDDDYCSYGVRREDAKTD